MHDIVLSSLLFIILSMVVAFSWAPVLIDILYVLKCQSDNLKAKNILPRFVELHGHKIGTPSLGGILIWLNVPFMMVLTMDLNKNYRTFIFAFLLSGSIGLLDEGIVDYFKKKSKTFMRIQDTFIFRMAKLALMYLFYSFVAFLFLSRWNVALVDALPDMMQGKVSISLLFGLLFVFSAYAMEIIDGIDGLAAGTFMISFFGFLFLLVIQGRLEFVPVIAIIIGTLITYLYFNIPPARVFMGMPGTLPVATALLFIALSTNNVLPYFLITFLFWVDLASSALQLLSYEVFKRKLILMAPLHHYFEAIGWPEYKVTMRLWLFQIIMTVLGIFFGMV